MKVMDHQLAGTLTLLECNALVAVHSDKTGVTVLMMTMTDIVAQMMTTVLG